MYEDKKKSPVLLILFGIVLVLISLIVFFLWKSPDSSKTSNNTSVTPTVTSTPTSSITTTNSITPTPSPTATATSIANPTPTTSVAPTGSQTVKVYYSQAANPSDSSATDSYKSFGYAVYRQFTSTRGDIENFVIEKTIAGPSATDKSTYYWFSPIALTGTSNCGTADFSLTKESSANKITVQFCKDITSSGVGDDARIKTVITYGMQQFLSDSSTKNIVILNKDGNCLGDASGSNKCKG